MNGLPPSVPLPPEVRERALGTVLAGMDAAPRTRAPFLAAAAAVVVALTVSVAVALSSSGPADPVRLLRARRCRLPHPARRPRATR
jgi:hypothetical protein